MAVSLIYLVHMAVVLQVFRTHVCNVHCSRAHTFSKHGCSVTYRDCHWNAKSTAGGGGVGYGSKPRRMWTIFYTLECQIWFYCLIWCFTLDCWHIGHESLYFSSYLTLDWTLTQMFKLTFLFLEPHDGHDDMITKGEEKVICLGDVWGEYREAIGKQTSQVRNLCGRWETSCLHESRFY